MTYVLSAKAFGGMNIEEILSGLKGGYFHVAPTIVKAAVINLGMTKEELMALVNMNYSLNIFDEDFSIQQLNSLSHDVIMISNGKIDSKKLPKMVEKIKACIGKKTILGVGLGKDLIALAMKELEDGEVLSKEGSILKNEKYKVFCTDGSTGNDFGDLIKYIV